jgi:hypothetical protein
LDNGTSTYSTLILRTYRAGLCCISSVRRQVFVISSRRARQSTDMSLDSPRPLVPLLPSKKLAAKVDLKFVRAFDADCSEHVVSVSRDVHSTERVGEAQAVPSEEDGRGGEFITKANRIAWLDTATLGQARQLVVVSSAVWILEEFAQVVEVQAGAESVPTWKTPGRVWADGRAWRGARIGIGSSWRRKCGIEAYRQR